MAAPRLAPEVTEPSWTPLLGSGRWQLQLGGAHSVDVIVVILEGSISVGRLHEAWRSVVADAPALRTRLRATPAPEASVSPDIDAPLVVRLGDVDGAVSDLLASTYAVDAPPARAVFVPQAGGGALLIAAHHALVDGRPVSRAPCTITAVRRAPCGWCGVGPRSAGWTGRRSTSPRGARRACRSTPSIRSRTKERSPS
jgi:hypothetical protein